MLAALQRRRRPVSFPSSTVLGGASLVVGAGATVIAPAAPLALRFSGYNTVAIAFALAGLSGGDVLAVKLGVQDPESATGAIIPATLGAANLVTGAVNGQVAGMLTLPRALTGSIQNVLAAADNTDGGWVNQVGSNVNLYQAISTIGDSATYLRYTIGAAAGLCVFDCAAGFANPLTTAGFVLHLTLRWNAISDIRNSKLNFHWAKNSGGDIIKKSWGTPAGAPDFPIINDGAFHDYTYNLTAGDIATAGGLAAIFASQIFRLQADFSGVTTGGGSVDVADFYAEVPPAGGGGANRVVPFYRNVLIFDNSASAHAATITNLRTELTNA